MTSSWPPRYAPADTLAGKLQRGLGTGFLEALDAPREVVHGLLWQCIRDDPALDIHLDERGWYYGELAFRTELPIGPIREMLTKWGEEEPDGAAWIAIDVLKHLAERGVTAANEAVRDYVTWGPWWDDAIYEFRGDVTSPEWRAIVPQLLDTVGADGVGSSWLVQPPFTVWAEVDDRVRRMVVEAEAQNRAYDDDVAALPGRSTRELLIPASSPAWRRLAEILAGRTTPADRAVIDDVLSSGGPEERARALWALALQGDFRHLDLAISLATDKPRPSVVSVIASDALLLASAETLLPLAR